MMINEPEVTFERPEKLTFKNVMFWEPESRSLMRKTKDGRIVPTSIVHKASLFIENKCIEKTEKGYTCGPIKNYNKTSYEITEHKGGYTCNCQGWANRLVKDGKGMCSHVLGVLQFKEMNDNI